MRRSLWFHTNFRRFWIGQTISGIGTQVTFLALPTIAILALHANPFEIGILEALQMITYLFIGPFVGVLADRFQRRPIMIAANIGSFLALVSIPVGMTLGMHTMYYLYTIALLISICTVIFDISAHSYIPALVGLPDLQEANAKSTLGDGLANITGPFLAGLVIQWIGAILSVLVDAASYLISALSLLLINSEEQKLVTASEHSRTSIFYEIREGFGAVFEHPVLRTLVVINLCGNIGYGMANALVLIFAYRSLALTPGQVGLALALGSVGFILGALLASPITRKIGFAPTLILGCILGGCSFLVLVLGLVALPFGFVCLWRFLFGLSGPIYDVNAISLRQRLSPEHVRGRIGATFRALSWGSLGVGSFLGGYLGTVWGLTPTIILGGLISISVFVLLLTQPIMTAKMHAQFDK